MSRVHVAIVGRGAARALLAGTKRVETRFYRQRRAPFGRIGPGDLVHFKLSGGDWIGSTHVISVQEFTGLTPARMADLRCRIQAAVQAPAAYWTARRRSRHGSLIWFGPLLKPPGRLHIPRQYGGGWLVLDAARSL